MNADKGTAANIKQSKVCVPFKKEINTATIIYDKISPQLFLTCTIWFVIFDRTNQAPVKNAINTKTIAAKDQ